MTRKISSSGINLFQLIYILKNEYEKKSGKQCLNLSLGNPDGVPPHDLLAVQSRFAADATYEYHTYAEDTNINHFCEGMVATHADINYSEHAHLKALPIQGIKGASAILPLACGLHLPDKTSRSKYVTIVNKPAYDIIGNWSSSYFGGESAVWPLLIEDNMRLNMDLLEAKITEIKTSGKIPNVIFTIRPGNPAAVGANKSEWERLIRICCENKIRLVNDGAYAGLCEDNTHTPLCEVAKDYPELEWAEMFSVSKSFNQPGARLGAIVGHKDFIDDFNLVKGNTDSGPNAGVMAAYGEYFKGNSARKALRDIKDIYRKRLNFIIPNLKEAGLRPACDTEAGFFTLWQTPKYAFGQDLDKSEYPRHEAFNRLVIDNTGIVGVHFLAEANSQAVPLIRYAVCSDVLAPAFKEKFLEGLSKIRPEY